MSADLRSAVIDIGFPLNLRPAEASLIVLKSGRTGMSSRSVATLLPATFKLSRIACLYRFPLRTPARSGLAGREAFPADVFRDRRGVEGWTRAAMSQQGSRREADPLEHGDKRMKIGIVG